MPEINIDELLKILPRLIRENDAVKGAIITALSGVVATRDDIRDLIEQINKRFDQSDKRFDQMQATIDARFKQSDKRFDQMQATIDKRFDEVNERHESLLVMLRRIEGKEGMLLERTILDLMRET
ncbi:MAG: hypothetical protein ACTSWN_10975, partial [Promethearchaeota archaeon]